MLCPVSTVSVLNLTFFSLEIEVPGTLVWIGSVSKFLINKLGGSGFTVIHTDHKVEIPLTALCRKRDNLSLKRTHIVNKHYLLTN
jgi:hypothetical protein